MCVSGLIVGLASNYFIYIAGRALIGVAIGGFWSMSAAVAMRLVPATSVPKALAIFTPRSGHWSLLFTKTDRWVSVTNKLSFIDISRVYATNVPSKGFPYDSRPETLSIETLGDVVFGSSQTYVIGYDLC